VTKLVSPKTWLAALVLCVASGCSCGNKAQGNDAGIVGDSGSAADSGTPDSGTDGGGPGRDGGPASPYIQHIIFMVKENRTYNVYFGRYDGGLGALTGKISDGGTVALGVMDDRVAPDINHSWDSALLAYHDGGMDRFDLIAGAHAADGGLHGYVVANPNQIPNYYSMAGQYGMSDNFFSSLHGPSFPNHLFTIAAQSGGFSDEPALDGGTDRIGVMNNPGGAAGASAPLADAGQFPGVAGYEPAGVPGTGNGWGCDNPATSKVQVMDQEGDIEEIYPCLDFPTLADELSAAGISWRMYAVSEGGGGYIWTVYDAIRHIRDSADWQAHIFPLTQFAVDAAAGNLPAVTWISTGGVPGPDGGVIDISEHPAASTCIGENWTVDQLNALGGGPAWSSSVMFITWDDFGGFYDPVAPAQLDKYGLGFRVPFLAVSPYAKAGYLDHSQAEFSSVLRFIESTFDVPTLTNRDSNTSDLLQFFDFTQAPRAYHAFNRRPSCP
jgi:phospholipase C